MAENSENPEKIECISCKNYYLYFSRKQGDYIITSSFSEVFDNEPWLSLKDEKLSGLIQLLQEHELMLQKQKSNLRKQDSLNYYFPDPGALANLAREINETAQNNKKNKANLSEKVELKENFSSSEKQTKVINMQDYQNQKEDELINRIVQLADHLPISYKNSDNSSDNSAS